ncbi:MAG: hypothetical protein ACRDV7_08205 [Acidimicrobiia bacterium]|jgi:hypothetical protein
MEIVAALFVEGIEFRQVEGPSTRIDITGAFFSTAVESYPAALTPHLVVLVRSPNETDGNGTLETVFVREATGEEIGRNKQPFFVEPGKFGYRLVRGELEFPEPGTIEARCTILESGSAVTVPLTALPVP